MEKFPKSYLVFMERIDSLPKIEPKYGWHVVKSEESLIGYSGVCEYVSDLIRKASKFDSTVYNNTPTALVSMKMRLSKHIMSNVVLWDTVVSPLKTICEAMLNDPCRFKVLSFFNAVDGTSYTVYDKKLEVNLSDMIINLELSHISQLLYTSVVLEVFNHNENIAQVQKQKEQEKEYIKTRGKLENLYGKD